jgi:hypothetical protein
MIIRIAVAALSASLALSAAAETPNIEPGEWENTSTITFTSEMPIPDQSDTSTNCITAEDINSGDFMQDMEGCTVTERDLRADGMDYAMECNNGGMAMTMTANMQFNGDTMEGTVKGEMESPMGPMEMNVTMSGRRLGDCPD